jgi:hypothetical protein
MLGYLDVYVYPEQGVNPYFCHSVSNPSIRWWRGWSFLWNDATTPLSEVIGRRPATQPC